MKRAIEMLSKGALCAGVLALSLVSTPARAQVVVEIGPPAEYIATTEPVYFEGRPAYWYGDRWYYRDGGSWRHYRDEPAHLRNYRRQHVPVRQYYGRAHGGGVRVRR
jgi:hypothetical protein